MILKQFPTTYTKKGQHRAKCKICGGLIDDGRKVQMILVKTEKYYPVKGFMGFTTWQFEHLECHNIN